MDAVEYKMRWKKLPNETFLGLKMKNWKAILTKGGVILSILVLTEYIILRLAFL